MNYLVIIATAMSIVSAKPVECAPAGCSGQICASKEEAANIMSTCEWRESYACYKEYGKCEAQGDGKCGWTPTQALQECVSAAN